MFLIVNKNYVTGRCSVVMLDSRKVAKQAPVGQMCMVNHGMSTCFHYFDHSWSMIHLVIPFLCCKVKSMGSLWNFASTNRLIIPWSPEQSHQTRIEFRLSSSTFLWCLLNLWGHLDFWISLNISEFPYHMPKMEHVHIFPHSPWVSGCFWCNPKSWWNKPTLPPEPGETLACGDSDSAFDCWDPVFERYVGVGSCGDKRG